MKYQDYYQTLGVDRGSTQDDIQKSYRKLARKFHPDVNKSSGAEEKFKEINEAYEVLKDPEKRKLYDQLGANWKSGQDFKVPPGWEGGYQFNFGNADFGSGGFSDFFEALFGGGSFQGFGGDENVFKDFESGGKRVRYSTKSGGQRPNTRSQRYDALHELTIAPWDAVLGAQVMLKLSTGSTIRVNIPAGSQDGQKLRVKGKGLQSHSGQTGDLYLQLKVRLPSTITPREKELWEALRAASSGKGKAA